MLASEIPVHGSAREEIMFCDGCGTTVQPGQALCSQCGKQIVGPVSVMQERQGRVQGHLHLLAIFWFAITAFNAIIGVVLYILANTLLAPGGAAGAPAFLRPLLSVVAIIVLGGSALGFSAGWGLVPRQPWAPTLVLDPALLVSFINIPLGAAVGR